MQIIKENYSIHNCDVMELITQMPDDSIDFSVYSPPFCSLFSYSSDPRDFSNVTSKEQFLEQYDYLIKEMKRITKPGRLNAVHCADTFENSGKLWDFPHEVIAVHDRNGFDYCSRITIWKEPLKIRMRTMVQSLTHKNIVEDATKCFPSMPDYILLFKRRGENSVPVTHEEGLTEYYGEVPILPGMLKAWNNKFNTSFTADELWSYLDESDKEKDKTKRAHYIWQRYASSLWDDVRNDHTLPYREAKEEDDERHIHPLQLDVICRLILLYTNPGEIVFSPFGGVMSESYGAVKLGRKAISAELKTSYFKQGILNMQEAERIARESHEQITFDDINK